MLFEILDSTKLKTVEFSSAKMEKHLEELLVNNLFSVFFDQPLLAFHQEVCGEPVADIYALNAQGDIIIFELKRDVAGHGALDQLLRYAGNAGLWSYKEIEAKYWARYNADKKVSLIEAHRKFFELEEDSKLREGDFNREQHLWVVGSAADTMLMQRIDYWKSKGISIDFFPYRIYDINNKAYLEFFAKPYDYHLNPAERKGVLFDTNGSYDHGDGYECFREMAKASRISAYGERSDAVRCLNQNDYVFYSQVGKGVICAAKVKGRNYKKTVHPDHGDEWYWEVELLTDLPSDLKDIPTLMNFSEIKDYLGRDFWWARIDKRPYLNSVEAEELVNMLKHLAEQKNLPF